jgi:plastocyanin
MTAKPAGAVLTLTAAALLPGCGSSQQNDPPPPPAASSGAVAIKDFKFAPARLTVKVGAKVTITNADRAPHTATSKPAFDTGVLSRGRSKVVTIAKAGTFAYVCELHPYMKATIVAR